MTLYESWVTSAYDKNGQSVKDFWDTYMPTEQKVYEKMLEDKNTKIKGTVKELAEKYGFTPECMCGFLDGIKDAIDCKIDHEKLDESTAVDANVNFETLYKKMVEYKADHLYTLPQWNNIFSAEERKVMYTEQKKSKTIVKEEQPGRNDPCPCGSGKKYKKCCGAA